MSVKEKMTAIADAIRDKTGGTDALTLEGIANGVNEVFDTGKKTEQQDFWKVLTNNGEKGVYYYTFTENRWTRKNFKPTCNIVPTEADHTFYRHNYGNTAYDFAQQLENLGVRLDFSNSTNSANAFDNALLTRIPEINNAKGTFTCMFRQAASLSKLKTIDKIICNAAGDQNFTQTFSGCSKLENITFEGVIGRSISFPASPLSVASLKSIINCLKDYTGTDEYTYTVTFKASAFTALEAENEISPNGNAWAEYIDDLKWNLTLS